ncbi:DUF3592 domain-containing protein [Hymenobacter lucidus]|uniref:DUF3592 domain-containing protein n=1 Tax=Hymenobacter lucidus TaxID=2880930 RepID=A0ABS8AWA3_9BACT|nr:DUF3592 domain-containing protein [Hymenobacter lucidus]MCB2409851.1 DUF3592 domain-containing protein [Hymenobacter lucidus]
MSWQNGFTRAVGRWLLRPLCLLCIVLVLWNAGKRWRMLHGTPAAAVVHQRLGKEGSGSSGVYTLVVRYSPPQQHQQFAQVSTDRSTSDSLPPGTPVQVCYRSTDPANALLSTEQSYSWQLMGITLVCLVVFFSTGNVSGVKRS